MSQEDVEIIRGLFDANINGDLGAWFQGADPDIHLFPRPAEPDAEDEYRGLDGLMEWAVNWYSQWDEYEIESVELTDAGQAVLAVATERGRVERTGLEVVEEFSHSFVLRDGKVVEWRMYDSHADALEALGLQ